MDDEQNPQRVHRVQKGYLLHKFFPQQKYTVSTLITSVTYSAALGDMILLFGSQCHRSGSDGLVSLTRASHKPIDCELRSAQALPAVRSTFVPSVVCEGGLTLDVCSIFKCDRI